MSEKLFDMKPIRWNSLSSCCCDRTAPVVKLDASHSRQKGPDLEGKASIGVEVMGNLREVADESLVEVHKPYEGLDILDFCWLQPVCDSLDLNGVHHYVVLRDNKPKVVHLLMFKLAFLWL